MTHKQGGVSPYACTLSNKATKLTHSLSFAALVDNEAIVALGVIRAWRLVWRIKRRGGGWLFGTDLHLTMNQMHFGNHSTSERDGSSAKKSPWNLPAGYRNISATGLHVNLETVMA